MTTGEAGGAPQSARPDQSAEAARFIVKASGTNCGAELLAVTVAKYPGITNNELRRAAEIAIELLRVDLAEFEADRKRKD